MKHRTGAILIRLFLLILLSACTSGTSGLALDTDGDGLSDADEIKIYGTDPTIRIRTGTAAAMEKKFWPKRIHWLWILQEPFDLTTTPLKTSRFTLYLPQD